MQSDLILFPKEEIDISLIWFGKGLHGDASVWTSLFILFRTPDLSSDNPKPDQDPIDIDRSRSPSGCRTHGGPSSMI